MQGLGGRLPRDAWAMGLATSTDSDVPPRFLLKWKRRGGRGGTVLSPARCFGGRGKKSLPERGAARYVWHERLHAPVSTSRVSKETRAGSRDLAACSEKSRQEPRCQLLLGGEKEREREKKR